MRLSLFSDGAIYNETSGKKGVIDKLQAPRAQVLPNNFINLGVDFAYGMQNSDIYTRVWRPYFMALMQVMEEKFTHKTILSSVQVIQTL